MSRMCLGVILVFYCCFYVDDPFSVQDQDSAAVLVLSCLIFFICWRLREVKQLIEDCTYICCLRSLGKNSAAHCTEQRADPSDRSRSSSRSAVWWVNK